MTLPTDLSVLIHEVEAAGFPRPTPEFAFMAPERRFRFDLAWIEEKVSFEREGIGGSHPAGIGRHQTRDGYRNDCFKYNEAGIRGWLVVRGTAVMLLDGTAAKQLIRALQSREGGG